MSEYPSNKKNNTFTWLSSLYNPFKRLFFLKNRLTHFHINSNIVIRPTKRNQFSFSSIEINKLLPAPVHSLS